MPGIADIIPAIGHGFGGSVPESITTLFWKRLEFVVRGNQLDVELVELWCFNHKKHNQVPNACRKIKMMYAYKATYTNSTTSTFC